MVSVNGFDLVGTMTQGVGTVQGDLFTVLGIVTVAIVSVVGAVVAVKFGVRWLKSLGKA